MTTPRTNTDFNPSEHISPKINSQYNLGAIDERAFLAFSLTPDHQQQDAALEALRHFGLKPYAHQVRKFLLANATPVNTPLAQFVGESRYQQHHGVILTDRFARDDQEQHWYQNTQLLRSLALQTLQEFVDSLRKHWRWVAPVLSSTDADHMPLASIKPATKPSPEQRERLQQLQEIHSQHIRLFAKRGWSNKDLKRNRKIINQINRIEREIHRRSFYSDEQRTVSGCIVTINPHATVDIRRGLVLHEDLDLVGLDPNNPPPPGTQIIYPPA